jgi:glutathione synthase/RimK-type ligase-like ATP-grasp enzyme
MTGPVLLWGLAGDPPLHAVRWWLDALSADVVMLDHAAVARTRAGFSTSPEFAHRVTVDGATWRLEDFAAAYLRPYDARHYEAAPRPAELTRASRVHHVIYDWAEYADATVVNRPSAEATNHSKLRQAMEIRACGFLTPASLVANEAGRIREFMTAHGRVVYKSSSSVRSVARELAEEDLPTGPMGPVLVQELIAGVNVRVHVVGDHTFGCRIDSDAVDYRYATSALGEVELEPELAARCVALTRRLGLLISGIDLIGTPDGAWYCLEVNPNPAFTAFDDSSDQAIARAVAEMLAGYSARTSAPCDSNGARMTSAQPAASRRSASTTAAVWS